MVKTKSSGFTFVKYAKKKIQKVKNIEKTGWSLEDVHIFEQSFRFYKDVKVRIAYGKDKGEIKVKRKYKSVRMSNSEWRELNAASEASALGIKF